MHHYVPVKWHAHAPSGVILHANERRYFPWRKRKRLYAYVGRRRRGGYLNHLGRSGPFVRIDIAGADLLNRLRDGRVWYRRWDSAIFIVEDYEGPGAVVPDVDPIRERGRHRARAMQ